MKKFLSSSILLLVLLVILWFAASWYFSVKSEQAFNGYLQQHSQIVGQKLFRLELLHYKKTLLGANAKLRMSSDYAFLNERFGALPLDVTLQNGPVFFTKSGLDVGSSRWNFQIEKRASKTAKQNFKVMFPNVLPQAVARISFDGKAHYSSALQTEFAKLLVTGIFDLKTEDNRGAITIKPFSLGVKPNIISAEKIRLSYKHQKAITASYKPGTASLQVLSLQLNHDKLPKPLLLDLTMNSNISLKENNLNGFVKATIKNHHPEEYPFEKANISMLFKGLPADGFIAFSGAHAELDNLHQQTQWVLEELGELPEGQDQIWQLYDEIEQSSKQLPNRLIALGKNSAIQLKTITHYKGSKSLLKGNIKLAMDNPKLTSWLSLLEGEATVQLDKALFSLLAPLTPIKKQTFTLLLEQNKLLMKH